MKTPAELKKERLEKRVTAYIALRDALRSDNPDMFGLGSLKNIKMMIERLEADLEKYLEAWEEEVDRLCRRLGKAEKELTDEDYRSGP